MKTAFGVAMMESIQTGHPQVFRMAMKGHPPIQMSCRDFIELRDDENELLRSISLPTEPKVLDWGCGAGRHLKFIRQNYPQSVCCGIEISDDLLAYCQQTIQPPCEFVQTYGQLSVHEFDLIMLMGNGLGVLGDEKQAIQSLRTLIKSLRPGGHLLIETGNPFTRGYFATHFEINYDSYSDEFVWGYADRQWVKDALSQSGDIRVEIHSSKAPGGQFFFAVGTKQ